jgi:hypothetical protein
MKNSPPKYMRKSIGTTPYRLKSSTNNIAVYSTVDDYEQIVRFDPEYKHYRTVDENRFFDNLEVIEIPESEYNKCVPPKYVMFGENEMKLYNRSAEPGIFGRRAGKEYHDKSGYLKIYFERRDDKWWSVSEVNSLNGHELIPLIKKDDQELTSKDGNWLSNIFKK